MIRDNGQVQTQNQAQVKCSLTVLSPPPLMTKEKYNCNCVKIIPILCCTNPNSTSNKLIYKIRQFLHVIFHLMANLPED